MSQLQWCYRAWQCSFLSAKYTRLVRVRRSWFTLPPAAPGAAPEADDDNESQPPAEDEEGDAEDKEVVRCQRRCPAEREMSLPLNLIDSEIIWICRISDLWGWADAHDRGLCKEPQGFYSVLRRWFKPSQAKARTYTAPFGGVLTVVDVFPGVEDTFVLWRCTKV